MHEALHGVAELPSYIRLADKLLSAEERQDLIGYLAEHPKAGDIMEGTGGYASCAGVVAGKARAVACGSSTTTTMTSCRCTC